jgi:hypothetical protein
VGLTRSRGRVYLFCTITMSDRMSSPEAIDEDAANFSEEEESESEADVREILLTVSRSFS